MSMKSQFSTQLLCYVTRCMFKVNSTSHELPYVQYTSFAMTGLTMYVYSTDISGTMMLLVPVMILVMQLLLTGNCFCVYSLHGLWCTCACFVE